MDPLFDLSGKIALVTGGSRGIGAAIAAAMARQGAKVVISSRKAPELEATAARINAEQPGSVLTRPCHTGTPSAVEELVAWVEREVGLPDVAVNNAATNPHFGPILTAEESHWDKIFEVNVKGYFFLAKAVAPVMKAVCSVAMQFSSFPFCVTRSRARPLFPGALFPGILLRPALGREE